MVGLDLIGSRYVSAPQTGGFDGAAMRHSWIRFCRPAGADEPFHHPQAAVSDAGRADLEAAKGVA